MKRCPSCGVTKPHAEFGSDRSQHDRLGVYCRPCQRVKQREWRARHPDRVRAENKRRRAAKREWEREWLASDVSRVKCSQCGQLCGAGSAKPSKTPAICASCIHDEYDRKARCVERLWNEGKTYPEIASEMGWSKGHLAREMDRYREDGYDLPYRYKTGKRNATKFPEQVAA
jgi:hypothetical protein